MPAALDASHGLRATVSAAAGDALGLGTANDPPKDHRRHPGARSYTDEGSTYDGLESHESVKHSVGEYVRGEAHPQAVAGDTAGSPPTPCARYGGC